MNLRKEDGFALSDTSIAIIVIIIFTAIIASISYNIYLQSNFIKRNNTATEYIVDLFEYAKSINFSDVDYNHLSQHFSNINTLNVVSSTSNYTVNKGYTMIINIEELEEESEININEVYRKRITAEVKYKLGNKIKSITMNTIINK